MFTELVVAVEAGCAGVSLFENRTTILRILKRFRQRILRGTWHMPIFGDGGTGKTTLGNFLCGQLPLDSGGYSESVACEKFSLPGDVPCMILVPPGQARRRSEESHQDVYRLLAKGKSKGIINVVSWGCHSSEIGHKEHKVFKENMSDSDFVNAYLRYNREGELKALRELVPHLRSAKGKMWMVTLVTKQDLWWLDRHNVKDYYEKGEYAEYIEDIAAVKGREHFTHNYFSVSLIPENLKTADGKVLLDVAAGYDHWLRMANLRKFAEGLDSFLHKGETK